MYLKDALQIIFVVFMVGNLLTVFLGMIAIAFNGKLKKNHINKHINLRLLLQVIIVLVFVIIF